MSVDDILSKYANKEVIIRGTRSWMSPISGNKLVNLTYQLYGKVGTERWDDTVCVKVYYMYMGNIKMFPTDGDYVLICPQEITSIEPMITPDDFYDSIMGGRHE